MSESTSVLDSVARGFGDLFIQTFVSFLVLYPTFFVMFFFSEAPIDGTLDVITGVPLVAVLVILVNLVVVLIGLPIRLARKVREWWISRPIVSLVGTLIGIALLALTVLSRHRETVTDDLDFLPYTYWAYNDVLYWSGILILAFSLCHFWLPRRRIKRESIWA